MTNIVQYLKSQHIDKFKSTRKSKGKIAKQKQAIDFEATEDCMRLCNLSDPRAQRIAHRIGKESSASCSTITRFT